MWTVNPVIRCERFFFDFFKFQFGFIIPDLFKGFLWRKGLPFGQTWANMTERKDLYGFKGMKILELNWDHWVSHHKWREILNAWPFTSDVWMVKCVPLMLSVEINTLKKEAAWDQKKLSPHLGERLHSIVRVISWYNSAKNRLKRSFCCM